MKNTINTTNPFNNKSLNSYTLFTEQQVENSLELADSCFSTWKKTSVSERTSLLSVLGDLLNKNKAEFSELMTLEMGKPISQSRAEIEKCITLCDFYETNAESFLADDIIETEAEESYISYDPLGTILAVMPWNYPFWQVLRFAIPTVTAGNTVLLKHASNVTGCALAIQELFEQAGYPKGCFQTLLVDHKTIASIISNDIVKAVSLTGSEKAGKSIAEIAGKNLKKCVLELGGNNACIILDDADLDTYMDTIVNARMQNTGQSCIAAKRFIVTEGIHDTFIKRFKAIIENLRYSNPLDENTTISTLAREDLAEDLQKQVDDAISKGAQVVVGNSRNKLYFEATLLANATPEMDVFKEETFGPVAPVFKVKNLDEALKLAGNSKFGLGTMVFTKDIETVSKKVIEINDGAFFINELVKSDSRLPFGGTKASGYGRELSQEGIREFVNVKTVYIKH
ncbi:NAD-dependent succinate-semialdehyde dehydrogenase [Bizionia paragorgiae]|uniref:Succinate-semialdehyde dehydrogenase / glutarate-semialdehyde dehydrogenase n=1 Tax=Bizionia paragorgiae TaxID=283786 RepID=A0A1H3Y0I6_BIZPA|nr:NAD-dependent succinate-semialdehyde dehydrogenase [Bizionia paragorgiae]SEA05235.1 succinate-semialdehyde dehydrogenase / glutarate-semialdehyde dehydrogenase [Bizionia paragorgiae]